MAAREAWTDERLDDLSGRMDASFARVEADLRATNDRMDAGFARVDARLDALQRTIALGFAGLAGSVIASAVGALIATQV